MIRLSIVLVAISMLAGGTAIAQSECERPETTVIPDGASATLEEMLEAQAGVRAFLDAMNGYIDCMDARIEAAAEDTPPETINGWIEARNSAVGEEEALAARFNEERQAYQQANPSQ